MNTTEIERARLDLIVGDLDHKFTTGKVAESIADIRNVLQWESHRMGAVSAGVLRGAVERLESVTANAEVTGGPLAARPVDCRVRGEKSALAGRQEKGQK